MDDPRTHTPQAVRQRHARIMALLERGLKAREICERLGVSQSMVTRAKESSVLLSDREKG